jgi:hypothetical protein
VTEEAFEHTNESHASVALRSPAVLPWMGDANLRVRASTGLNVRLLFRSRAEQEEA